MELRVTNISFGSLFKLFFFATIPVVFSFCLFGGLMVLLQGMPNNPEPNQLYGFQALGAALIIGVGWPLAAGLLFAAVGKLGLIAALRFMGYLTLELQVASSSKETRTHEGGQV